MSKQLLTVILATSALMGCKTTTENASSAGKELVIFVDSQKADCVGVAPMKCLKVREREDQPWQFFYGNIEGFKHNAGTNYKLLVKETPVQNPPADASSVKTTLIRILSEK